jgi:hypothetical protein
VKRIKDGGFLIRNVHKQQKEFSSHNREKMEERLVLYRDVEYIRTSVKKKNFVDFIVCRADGHKRDTLEYLSKRVGIGTLIKQLPMEFIQINQSEIINANYIVGRSKSYLFTENKVLKISKSFKNRVDCQLQSLYDF